MVKNPIPPRARQQAAPNPDPDFPVFGFSLFPRPNPSAKSAPSAVGNGTVAQTLTQSDNPSQPSSQTQKTIRTRTYFAQSTTPSATGLIGPIPSYSSSPQLTLVDRKEIPSRNPRHPRSETYVAPRPCPTVTVPFASALPITDYKFSFPNIQFYRSPLKYEI